MSTASTSGGWVVPPQLLTADEVADMLRAPSARTVHRLRLKGDLAGVRVGRSWRYHADDVATYINTQRTGAPLGNA